MPFREISSQAKTPRFRNQQEREILQLIRRFDPLTASRGLFSIKKAYARTKGTHTHETHVDFFFNCREKVKHREGGKVRLERLEEKVLGSGKKRRATEELAAVVVIDPARVITSRY